MESLDSIWSQTLTMCRKVTDDLIVYDSVISSLKARDLTNNKLIITTEAAFNLDIVKDYVTQLEEIFNDLNHSEVHIEVLDEASYDQKHEKENLVIEIKDHLNSDFTFQNFVVGNSNRIAQNASLAVAMKPGNAYSPLFIYSNSGLGKTHLLHAIGNYIKERKVGVQVLYSTTEEFVNEYISAISNRTINDFNYRYRNIDVLLVDDIQFIASKDASSEMFFNIFNTLQNENKQIVISSDKPPKELKGIEQRLVSRFTNGLTVSIDTPEFETAKAIIKKKIELEKVDYPIDESVIDFIASHFNRDVRELEGSLKRLLFYKLVFGQDKDIIDMEFALEAFKEDYQVNEKKDKLSVDTIKKCVADYYNLSVSQINSNSRTANITVARHIAIYLVRNLIDGISYIQIGKEFGGRDHATCIKACNKVEAHIKKDSHYKQAIEELKRKLC